MNAADAKEAAQVTAETMRKTWSLYEKGFYPKKALEFDISQLSSENLAKMIGKTHSFLFVAEEKDKIIGVAVGEILRGHDKVGGLARLSWICVYPSKQRNGIGKALLHHVLEHCRKQKCHKITLYTLQVLIPALNLYFKTGFIPEAFLRKEWWKVDFIKMSTWLEKE
jgi:ribosomal protein S18 acetylase RimI-like enzyme